MTENNIIENNWYIKSRYLFLIFILSFIISIVLWLNLSPEYFSDNPTPMSDVLFDYVWYGILLFLLYLLSKKASVDWKALVGKSGIELLTTRYLLAVLPLIAISIAGIYLLYYPRHFGFQIL